MRALAKLHTEAGIRLHTTQRPRARVKAHDDLQIRNLQTVEVIRCAH